MQATASPAMAGTRNSRRTSSEPNRASAGVAISVCTPIAIGTPPQVIAPMAIRSEEHTSELQSQSNLVCRLLLEKKKTKNSDSLTAVVIFETDPRQATAYQELFT